MKVAVTLKVNVDFEWQFDFRVYNESDKNLVLDFMNDDAMENQGEGSSAGLVV
jgi:hypothetical protein